LKDEIGGLVQAKLPKTHIKKGQNIWPAWPYRFITLIDLKEFQKKTKLAKRKSNVTG